MATITSANGILMLSARDLFAVPVLIEGYAVDDGWATPDSDMAEVQLGVDGKMSTGWIPYTVPMVIGLQADSVSREFFETIVTTQETIRENIILDGTLTLTAVDRKFTLTKGVITRGTKIPSGKKVLQPLHFEITWESVKPALV